MFYNILHKGGLTEGDNLIVQRCVRHYALSIPESCKYVVHSLGFLGVFDNKGGATYICRLCYADKNKCCRACNSNAENEPKPVTDTQAWNGRKVESTTTFLLVEHLSCLIFSIVHSLLNKEIYD